MSEIREGTLYKRIVIEDRTFDVYYGYESDADRRRGWEPTPIYPDLAGEPQYTGEGYLLANAYQEVCPHYKRRPTGNDDDWCDLCEHFDKWEDCLGLCRCERNRQPKNE